MDAVKSIHPSELAHIIKTSNDKVLVIDARTFCEFNTCHIISSVNVWSSKIRKKRLQRNLLSAVELLEQACHVKAGELAYEEVVVYDQSSLTSLSVPCDSFLHVLLAKLFTLYSKVSLLHGGFVRFQAQYYELCEDGCPKGFLLTSLSQPCLPVANCGPTIILPFLFLGSQYDANDRQWLRAHNICYELNVSTTCPKPDFVSDSQFFRVAVNDNFSAKLLPHFEDAFRFIDKVREAGGRVLVHCLAGISRSPTVVISYVMNYLGLHYDEAYRFVKTRRPSISPNINFVGQLLEWDRRLFGASQVPRRPSRTSLQMDLEDSLCGFSETRRLSRSSIQMDLEDSVCGFSETSNLGCRRRSFRGLDTGDVTSPEVKSSGQGDLLSSLINSRRRSFRGLDTGDMTSPELKSDSQELLSSLINNRRRSFRGMDTGDKSSPELKHSGQELLSSLINSSQSFRGLDSGNMTSPDLKSSGQGDLLSSLIKSRRRSFRGLDMDDMTSPEDKPSSHDDLISSLINSHLSSWSEDSFSLASKFNDVYKSRWSSGKLSEVSSTMSSPLSPDFCTLSSMYDNDILKALQSLGVCEVPRLSGREDVEISRSNCDILRTSSKDSGFVEASPNPTPSTPQNTHEYPTQSCSTASHRRSQYATSCLKKETPNSSVDEFVEGRKGESPKSETDQVQSKSLSLNPVNSLYPSPYPASDESLISRVIGDQTSSRALPRSHSSSEAYINERDRLQVHSTSIGRGTTEQNGTRKSHSTDEVIRGSQMPMGRPISALMCSSANKDLLSELARCDSWSTSGLGSEISDWESLQDDTNSAAEDGSIATFDSVFSDAYLDETKRDYGNAKSLLRVESHSPKIVDSNPSLNPETSENSNKMETQGDGGSSTVNTLRPVTLPGVLGPYSPQRQHFFEFPAPVHSKESPILSKVTPDHTKESPIFSKVTPDHSKESPIFSKVSSVRTKVPAADTEIPSVDTKASSLYTKGGLVRTTADSDEGENVCKNKPCEARTSLPESPKKEIFLCQKTEAVSSVEKIMGNSEDSNVGVTEVESKSIAMKSEDFNKVNEPFTTDDSEGVSKNMGKESGSGVVHPEELTTDEGSVKDDTAVVSPTRKTDMLLAKQLLESVEDDFSREMRDIKRQSLVLSSRFALPVNQSTMDKFDEQYPPQWSSPSSPTENRYVTVMKDENVRARSEPCFQEESNLYRVNSFPGVYCAVKKTYIGQGEAIGRAVKMALRFPRLLSKGPASKRFSLNDLDALKPSPSKPLFESCPDVRLFQGALDTQGSPSSAFIRCLQVS